MSYPAAVRLFEVGARDGLQNEKQEVPTAIKVELIERLVEAGVTAIETGSFVSPKWVPQMADTDKVMAEITRKSGVVYSVLTPNMTGYEMARASGATEIEVFSGASEAFSQKNINCTIDESLDRFAPVMEAAKQDGIPVRASVSCALGSPFKGEVILPAKVADVSKKLYDMGCYEVSIADTIGVGTPFKTREVLEAVANVIPLEVMGVHFHDTYGQALANLSAALQMGIARLDSSVAGLGGCPYAPGATGNVATEDVVYMLNGMGIETGIDLNKLVETAWFISGFLGRKPVSRVANAMKAKL
ncbi:hydroxymethylglutaryl-CoA lyase [Sneathiella chinensis]|uniref:hydroxymethylglutaryl-CoA lyase n=1 Tax=Sneathiella chinensis TaxID=349750 RepID=A0ABQ5U6E3_9PROT|nr:hydroxymethylglutaryl-CoA lyase [Sneathiella chinensis]GLQ07725.1 hydroxymethylglutaryl-CoA lyase [Sneathiella chinensis]